MKSELITAVFTDELERTKRLLSRYEKEAAMLPKGSIFKRKIGKREYFYLNYRDGQKVVSEFLGKDGVFDETELREKIARRKELNQLIRKLKIEQKQLEKELR